MPLYRYNGPSKIVYRNADDKNPFYKGGMVNLSKAFVDHMTASGHSFTEQEDMKPAQVADARAVNADAPKA